MAAESYARLSGRLAAVNVTTGPGGTNAITGIYGAYVDSLGMVVISGQVKRATLAPLAGVPLRQLGDQEVDILPLVRPLTKYAVRVDDPTEIRYHLEKAIALAGSGRPGPVWLDIPIDIQAATIDPADLRGYDPATEPPALPDEDAGALTGAALEQRCGELLEAVRAARRPVVLPGSGVRISGAYQAFRRFVETQGLPVATAFNAHDLLANDHPLYVGRPGTVGERAGNFAVQNADLVLVLGCRLNIRQVSYNWENFARNARVAMVDIDRGELAKPTLSVDLPVHADLKVVLDTLNRLAPERVADHGDWLGWCRARLDRYPVVLPAYRQPDAPINPYVFAEALWRQLGPDDVVVTGDGTACVVTFQAADLKPGQRLYSNSGSAPMGFDLPAAVGAWAAGARRVICMAGDGSMMMNLQELATIAHHHMNVKVFLHDNAGYHSIRQTQAAYFPDNPTGYDRASGVGFPDFERLAAAFGLPCARADRLDTLDAAIAATLAEAGPAFCHVVLDPEQSFAPKLASRRLEDGSMVSSPLEDMAPFLSREELAENMITEPTT
jgi:acetolactate synthase-1/2/3 large subunit